MFFTLLISIFNSFLGKTQNWILSTNWQMRLQNWLCHNMIIKSDQLYLEVDKILDRRQVLSFTSFKEIHWSEFTRWCTKVWNNEIRYVQKLEEQEHINASLDPFLTIKPKEVGKKSCPSDICSILYFAICITKINVKNSKKKSSKEHAKIQQNLKKSRKNSFIILKIAN